jgi:hypothetical protein
MFASTALTLFVVPVFYLQLDDAVNWVGATARRLWPGGQKERLGEVSGSD